MSSVGQAEQHSLWSCFHKRPQSSEGGKKPVLPGRGEALENQEGMTEQ